MFSNLRLWTPHDDDAAALAEKGAEVVAPHPSGVFVTNLGRVFRYSEEKESYREVTLTQGGSKGYLRAAVSRSYRPFVHILVLETFVGPCPVPTLRARRRNKDKTDNRLCNLYWPPTVCPLCRRPL